MLRRFRKKIRSRIRTFTLSLYYNSVVTLIDRVLKWTTAAACGYEAVAIVGKAFDPRFPLPTITRVTHSNRERRITYILAGGFVGLLFHHLLIEPLDAAEQ